MTNANKFNLLLDVVKLMHSLADGLEAVPLLPEGAVYSKTHFLA